MSTDRNIGGYEVGFKKPPKHSQFRKGTSGNLRGRPKGVDDFLLVLSKVLKQTVRINKNGSVKIVSKLEAIVLRLVNSAVNGDIDAIKTLAWLRPKNETQAEEESELVFILNEQPLGRAEGTYGTRVLKLPRVRF